MAVTPELYQRLLHCHGLAAYSPDAPIDILVLASAELLWWKDFIEYRTPFLMHIHDPAMLFKCIFHCTPNIMALSVFHLILSGRFQQIFCCGNHIYDIERKWHDCPMLNMLQALRVSFSFL